jgi:hypothetical protein
MTLWVSSILKKSLRSREDRHEKIGRSKERGIRNLGLTCVSGRY